MGNPAEIVIRRASPGDLGRLLPLVRAYREFYAQNPNDARTREFVDSHLRNGTSTIYLAEAAGDAVGFSQMFRSFSTVHLAPVWILEDLFVEPLYRGAGIATALLARAVEHAKDDRAGGMFLETAYDNDAAQRVYERAGWTREGRFYKYNAPLDG